MGRVAPEQMCVLSTDAIVTARPIDKAGVPTLALHDKSFRVLCTDPTPSGRTNSATAKITAKTALRYKVWLAW
jgi:hypothetical protein